MNYKRQLFLLLMLFIHGSSFGWGFWAHKRINRVAVFTLPSEMVGFYKKHIEYVTEHAVDPDKRRYAVKAEGARHYIDIDHYGAHPFDSVPEHWNAAVAKFGEDTLMAYGINPWHVALMLNRLTSAFKEGDVKRILQLSADIGHYIGDAHVPLHTSENYNGQMTNQHGIHGLWESRVPEILGEDYDYFVGVANYIEKPIVEAWKYIKTSHACVDSVLLLEKQLNTSIPGDQKYAIEQKGNASARVYSETYAKEYNQLLNKMAERRMRAAILAVGSFWMTAWVNAGQPDLDKLEINAADLQVMSPEENLPNKGNEIKDKRHIE